MSNTDVTATPISTSPAPNLPWSTPSNNRSLYTWSFLGAIGLLTVIIIFFLARCHLRRGRFAARVQRALDSGHLDPRVVRDISILPAGALYNPRSERSKKIKPLMYEVRLGGMQAEELDYPEESDVEADKMKLGASGWKHITPFAGSRQVPADSSTSTQLPANSTTLPSSTLVPASAPNIPPSAAMSHTASHLPSTALPDTTPGASFPPSDNLLLSVLISMPSPLPPPTADLIDMEGVLPDICIGVIRVQVVG